MNGTSEQIIIAAAVIVLLGIWVMLKIYFLPDVKKMKYDTGELRKKKYIYKRKMAGHVKEVFYYRSGKLNKIKHLFNGKQHGETKIFYEDGTPYIECTYNEGSLSGEYKIYDVDGSMMETRNY